MYPAFIFKYLKIRKKKVINQFYFNGQRREQEF